jgi:hypothetical protein
MALLDIFKGRRLGRNISAKGADVTALMAAATLKAAELKVLVAQIIALHPTGDANLTALNSILAELA